MEEFAKLFGLYDVVSYFVPGTVIAWQHWKHSRPMGIW